MIWSELITMLSCRKKFLCGGILQFIFSMRGCCDIHTIFLRLSYINSQTSNHKVKVNGIIFKSSVYHWDFYKRIVQKTILWDSDTSTFSLFLKQYWIRNGYTIYIWKVFCLLTNNKPMKLCYFLNLPVQVNILDFKCLYWGPLHLFPHVTP